MDETHAAAAWSRGQRILFQFAFVYLILYNLPFPLNIIPLPQLQIFLEVLSEPWSHFVIWVSLHVFHVTATVHPTGSGDTMLAYVEVFCILSLSVLATIVWALLDRKRAEYTRLNDWLRTYVRFSLAAAMLTYGGYKVIKGQFPGTFPDRLIETYGAASPMGLLWTFMGASTSYNVFSGLAEMISGLLLVARRTALLGALISIGVMSNVVMLNFSYDVPVKLYSLHLLAMAVFLMLPDVQRLLNIFLLNRPVPAAEIRPLFRAHWSHRSALIFRMLFFTALAGLCLYNSYSGSKEYGDLAPRPPFYGVWNVEDFALDGQVRPPLLTDPLRWRRVTFSYAGYVGIHLMTDAKTGYGITVSKPKKLWVLNKYDDQKWQSKLHYQEPTPGVLVLDGTFDGKPLHASLRKVPTSKFLLLSRGFHWVSEYPFNR